MMQTKSNIYLQSTLDYLIFLKSNILFDDDLQISYINLFDTLDDDDKIKYSWVVKSLNNIKKRQDRSFITDVIRSTSNADVLMDVYRSLIMALELISGGDVKKEYIELLATRSLNFLHLIEMVEGPQQSILTDYLESVRNIAITIISLSLKKYD
jgi:hypothetical protein